MDLYDPSIVPYTIPLGFKIFHGVLTKFHFLTKFPHLEKFVYLMKDLKYEQQSIFPLWGRVKLNFRDRYGKLNIFSKNSSCFQVFSPNSQKLSLVKKKIITQMDLYDPHMDLYTIPWGIIIFQGVLTKFNFSIKFPHLEKFVNLIKKLKDEHQSIFPLWWRVKLNFRDRYGEPNIFSENLSRCQVFSTNCQKMTLWHHWGHLTPP